MSELVTVTALTEERGESFIKAAHDFMPVKYLHCFDLCCLNQKWLKISPLGEKGPSHHTQTGSYIPQQRNIEIIKRHGNKEAFTSLKWFTSFLHQQIWWPKFFLNSDQALTCQTLFFQTKQRACFNANQMIQTIQPALELRQIKHKKTDGDVQVETATGRQHFAGKKT